MATTLSRREIEEREEKRIRKRRRSVLIVMSEIVLCLVLAITSYGVALLNSYSYEALDSDIYKETSATEIERPQEKVTVVPETSIATHTNESGEVIATEEVKIPPEKPRATGYRNILILGTDARSQESLDKGINTDVMIIASVNNDTGDIKLVSIYRDTIMRMEDGSGAKKYNKVNNQFAVSGISDTVSMINRNLGLDIGEYVIVNWYGVATVVNQLGGIELTIPNEKILTYFNSYLDYTNQATGLWAPELTAPGTYLMSGTQVVAFCRIRYGGYNDQGRTQNQREAIGKIFERAKQLLYEGQINVLLEAAQTGLGNVRTNLTMPDILLMAMELNKYSISATMGFPQSYTTGASLSAYHTKYGISSPLVANNFEEEVRQLHLFLFDDPDYQCSDFIKTISQEMMMDRTGQ
ncbi:MAG: LCP family protein [Lachnospiraceae bacterium]|nr:LCP family protein [Lachnospiraceae bacterium]